MRSTNHAAAEYARHMGRRSLTLSEASSRSFLPSINVVFSTARTQTSSDEEEYRDKLQTETAGDIHAYICSHIIVHIMVSVSKMVQRQSRDTQGDSCPSRPARSPPPSGTGRDRAPCCEVVGALYTCTKKERTRHPHMSNAMHNNRHTPLLQPLISYAKDTDGLISRTTSTGSIHLIRAYSTCCNWRCRCCKPELDVLHYLGSFSSTAFKTGKTCPASASDEGRHQ